METAISSIQEVKRASGFLIFLGILLEVLGFFSLGAPVFTGVTIEMMVGITMIVGGLLRIILSFRAKSWGSGLLAALVGLFTLACGVLMVMRPILGLTALTLLLAAYFFVEGFFEIALAFDWKPLKGWGWTLFGGIASVALGFLIWMQWPLSGAWAIGTLVGIDLILAGIGLMSLGIAGRTAAIAEDLTEGRRQVRGTA